MFILFFLKYSNTNNFNYNLHYCYIQLFASRFSIYGACIMGPSMYYWLRFLSIMFPGRALKQSVAKAVTEQVSVDPALILSFLYLMTLFEGKSTIDAKNEVCLTVVKFMVNFHANLYTSVGQNQILGNIQSGRHLLANSSNVQFCCCSPAQSSGVYQFVQHGVELLSGLCQTFGDGKTESRKTTKDQLI